MLIMLFVPFFLALQTTMKHFIFNVLKRIFCGTPDTLIDASFLLYVAYVFHSPSPKIDCVRWFTMGSCLFGIHADSIFRIEAF